MLNRVTNLTMSAAAQRTLQTQQSRLAELQEKATTLNKISRPSDDPAATAQALETRALLAANAQYGRNIDDGNTWLTAADSALEQATNVMHRIKDLTVQAGNGSLPQSGKDAIAIELDSLNKDLVSIANSKHLGRNIFAGSSDAASAFTGSRDPSPGTGTPPFNGLPKSPVERRISATETVRVDADGAAIFGSGAGSVFDIVSKMAADLRDGHGHFARDWRPSTLLSRTSSTAVRKLEHARRSWNGPAASTQNWRPPWTHRRRALRRQTLAASSWT